MHEHECGGTDQPSVQPASATQNQHHHQFSRAREPERIESDELRGLSKQRTGETRDRGTQGKDHHAMLEHGRADCRHAADAFPDPAQAQAKRRIDEPPQQYHDNKYNRKAVEIRCLTCDVEPEDAEELVHRHTG